MVFYIEIQVFFTADYRLCFFKRFICKFKKISYLCTRFSKHYDDSLAQQVEHIPFKDGVLGSSPKWITFKQLQIKKNKEKASEYQ